MWLIYICDYSQNASFMMMSSNGNIFRVTGPLCGEFTGPGEFPTQRPVTRSFDVFFDLRLNKRLSKQPWGWWFETLSSSLWRHCNVQRGYSVVSQNISCNAGQYHGCWCSSSLCYKVIISHGFDCVTWVGRHLVPVRNDFNYLFWLITEEYY